MNAYHDINNKLCVSVRVERIVVLSVLAVFAVASLVSVRAFALEKAWSSAPAEQSFDSIKQPMILKKSNLSMVDPCLPLLKTARHTSPLSHAMDRGRRSADNATALGLIIGLRFALGPREAAGLDRSRPPASLQVKAWPYDKKAKSTGALEALAVAQYRKCKNEQALHTLFSLRWSR